MSRKSLRDRNQAAPDRAPVPATPREDSHTTPSATPEDTTPRRDQAKKTSETHAKQMSVYFRPGEYDAARAAFLTDFQQLAGPHERFTDWITAAIEVHCQRTPEQRGPGPDGREAGKGTPRSLTLPIQTIERIHQAVAEDQAAQRWTSPSWLAREAVAAAVSDVRRRAGGQLLTPPKRLPARLVRSQG